MCVCVCVCRGVPICVCVGMCTGCRCLRRPKLEFGAVVLPVDAGNWTWVLCKNSPYSWHLSHLISQFILSRNMFRFYKDLWLTHQAIYLMGTWYTVSVNTLDNIVHIFLYIHSLSPAYVYLTWVLLYLESEMFSEISMC